MFDLTGEGSIMGYADPEQQKRFEELRSAASMAEERTRSAKDTAVGSYTAEMGSGMDVQDLRIFNPKAYAGAEAIVEHDLSQLTPEFGAYSGEFMGLKRIAVNPDETPARRKGGPVEAAFIRLRV